MKLDPIIHIVMHSVLSLKTECDIFVLSSTCRASSGPKGPSLALPVPHCPHRCLTTVLPCAVITHRRHGIAAKPLRTFCRMPSGHTQARPPPRAPHTPEATRTHAAPDQVCHTRSGQETNGRAPSISDALWPTCGTQQLV
jgi:hypothetical protein